MQKKYTVLQPQYLQSFECTGSACEYNCCNTWIISIDKKTYQRYKKCPNVEMKLKLAKNVIRDRSNYSDNNTYAKIKLNDDRSCPFLGENKLCSIQCNLGEEYLSTTCASYPRAYNIVNEILEISLSLSCPEAARIALLNDSLMEFELIEKEVSLDRLPINPASMIKRKDKLFEQSFEALRVFTISTLQNRLYPLWQRLVILGLFYDNLDRLISDNKIGGILNLIETYRRHLEQGTFLDSLENIPSNLKLQEEILKRLVPVTYDKNNDSPQEPSPRAPQEDELSAQCPEGIASYTLAYENYYRPVADKHEYIFENYLVNYVFKNLFPFGTEKSVFDNYVELITTYASLKTLLIRTAGLRKEKFNVATIETGIRFFCRSVEHDIKYLQSVSDFLKSNNFNNMAYMSILIKH